MAALRNSNGEFLVSEWLEASNIPGVSYRLKIYPNGDEEKNEKQTWLFLSVRLGKETKVSTDMKFSIESTGWSGGYSCEYAENESWGIKCFDTDKLFESHIINGKLTLECTGILSVERKLNCADADSDGDKWKMEGFFGSLCNGIGSDFAIVVDGKCIDVSFFYKIFVIILAIFFRPTNSFSQLDLLYFRQCSNPD